MSYTSTHADIQGARFTGHVWRSEGGVINGTVELSETAGARSWLSFDSPADARALAAACTEAAEEMDRPADGGQP